MRQGQQNRRGRGRHNGGQQGRKGQHHQNPLMRTYQSNGPDQKIHGTPAQIAEKYMALARDALSSGDPVLAENYLQHAEHYNRIILTYREQQMQQTGGEGMNGMPRHRPFPGAGEPFEGGDLGEEGEDFGTGDQPQVGMRPNEPQPRMFDAGQGRAEGRVDDRPRHQGQGEQQPYREHGQGQMRDRDGGRDQRDRHFRQRHGGHQQPRFGQERMERGGDGMRGDRDRGDRFEQGGQRMDRPDRGDRGPDRPERFARGEGGERVDRPERQDRPERAPRPAYVERSEGGERPIPAPAAEAERPVEAAQPVPAEPAAAPSPRRRERFTEPSSDQPEFLRRSVRRPRREASAAAEGGDDAAPAARPAGDRSGGE